MKDEVFKEAATIIANVHADELEVKNGLAIKREDHVEAESARILASLKEENEKLLNQVKASTAILVEELRLLPAKEQASIGKEFKGAMEKLDGYGGTIPLSETSLQESLGLSDKTLLWIYSIGHKHFQNGENEESGSIFSLLIMLNPMVYDYWMAFGFVQEALEDLEKAIHAFSFASLLDPAGPSSRYKSAEVYVKLELFEDALVELEVLEEIIVANKL
jgi:tetratricopeptide (TPR) repeat protein